eukprot:2142795-Ditylum_brightwellii.AAC.1
MSGSDWERLGFIRTVPTSMSQIQLQSLFTFKKKRKREVKRSHQTEWGYRWIQSSEIRFLIQAAVQAYGENKLGFKAEEVGTHSNRSAAAMA